MKREYYYVEEKQDRSNNISMFTKLSHQSHKFQQPNPPRSPPLPHHPEQAGSHSPNRQRNVSAEEPLPLPPPPPPPSHDGATIEVVRRPRGRPPGSKNKPKPAVIITRDTSEPPMSPYVLELPPGVDIIESTTRFCRRRGIGLCVLNGNGVVSNVSLKQPSNTPPATVTFHGRFDVLSMSATILPGGGAGNGSFAISLAGPQGQVVGGLVVGPLVSAGTIYIIAATFNSPSFHRLPQETDGEEGGGMQEEQESSQAVSGGDCGPSESCGVAIYSYQPSDVIWAPTARQPPPY